MNEIATDPHSHSDHRSFVSRYVFSTDHKVIAKQYLSLALFWMLMGAGSAYLIRWQIAHPDTEAFGWGYVEPSVYNQLVTMHGTIMVFFVSMPLLLAAFGNFLLPLMVGARDMAFPRLNMLSVWIFALASVVLITSFFVPGGAAAAGWTGYPPLSAKNEYTGGGFGMDLWLLALALEFLYDHPLHLHLLAGPDYSAMNLKTLHEWQSKNQLRTVPGVNEINTWGGETRQIQIQVEPARLQAYGLTLRDVWERVRENNANFGGGFIEHRCRVGTNVEAVEFEVDTAQNDLLACRRWQLFFLHDRRYHRRRFWRMVQPTSFIRSLVKTRRPIH